MRLLLDAHVPPAVAVGLMALVTIEVQALRHWQGGIYLDEGDDTILQAAHAAGWTLVTYDQRTIRPLLKAWSEQGIAHSGVIFVDEHTVAQRDVGGLIGALRHLVEREGDADWENRAYFLKRAP